MPTKKSSSIHLLFTVPPALAMQRLDLILSRLAPTYSRTLLQSWIKAGYVTVDNIVCRQQRSKINVDQTIIIDAKLVIQETDQPQAIKLNIIYSDQDIIVINKPVGLIVHPGAGCKDGTLMNALLYQFPELAHLPRAGIIHRLDKDTSGLLVIARSLLAHKKLIEDLQQRKIKREYAAIVWGKIIAGGTVDVPIGRHKTQRTHMAVTENGKPAITHYRVIERFIHHTYLHVTLETGRTHQIRVHMAHLNHPLVGDATYGGKKLQLPQKTANITTTKLHKFLTNFNHQALHATQLSLNHPRTLKRMQFNAPLPKDMQQLLKLCCSQTDFYKEI